ncbi:MAG: histidine kinase [Vulcanimicrobiaceae bacterium]
MSVMRHRSSDLEILRVIAEALNRSTDISAAMERTLALAAELLKFESGWIWLRDGSGGRFYLAASHNLPPFLQEPVRMTGSICWCIESLLSGDFRSRNVDSIECSRLRPAVVRKQTTLTRGMAYHASVALRFGESELGLMNLTAPRFRKVAKADLQLLQTIADHVGIAIERARLAETATQLARMRERTELARDLHDTFAQDLTGITLQLETALQYLRHDDVRAAERVQAALEVARDSVQRARRSVEELQFVPGSGLPLDSALAQLTRDFTSRTGIPVHAHVAITGIRPALEQAAYRIVQEALTNVRKHAKARNVWLDVSRSRGRLAVVVRDDGAGYTPGSAPGRMGVTSMRARAVEVGGTFSIAALREGGTQVRAAMPLVVK